MIHAHDCATWEPNSFGSCSCIPTLMTPLAREVADAYAAHDANPTPETYARVTAAIRAKTAATNPDELEPAS